MSLNEKYHHGRSPASWAGSMISLVGFVIAGVGFFMNINWTVVWIGFGIVAISLIVALAMQKMGMGQSWGEQPQ